MATQIKLRRDTAANWTSENPTLAEGEPGFETDTGKLKLGDGATAWTSLAYFGGGADAANGTYTPTITGVFGISGGTAALHHWQRIGNTVVVHGSAELQVTNSPGFATIDVPVSTANFTAQNQARGHGSGDILDHLRVMASTSGNQLVTLEVRMDTPTTQQFFYSFSYQIQT